MRIWNSLVLAMASALFIINPAVADDAAENWGQVTMYSMLGISKELFALILKKRFR